MTSFDPCCIVDSTTTEKVHCIWCGGYSHKSCAYRPDLFAYHSSAKAREHSANCKRYFYQVVTSIILKLFLAKHKKTESNLRLYNICSLKCLEEVISFIPEEYLLLLALQDLKSYYPESLFTTSSNSIRITEREKLQNKIAELCNYIYNKLLENPNFERFKISP
jgi:hypothetical protein